MRKTILLPLAMIIFLGLIWLPTGCQRKTDAHTPQPAVPTDAQPATPISVATIQPADIEERIEVTGSLQPADQVVVGSRLAGRIAWIIGDEGTPVRVGQVVARMEDQDMRTQVRAARAMVQAAEARQEQAEAAAAQQATATNSGIDTAQAALDAAKARLKQADTTARAQEATSQAQVASANAQLQQTQQALNAAKSRQELLKNGSRPQERAVAENNVKLAKTTLDFDKNNYDRYKGLYEQGAVSKSLLDSAEMKMKMSEAQYDSARQQLDLVKTGARDEDVQAAEAAVQQAQAAIQQAQAAVDAAVAGQKQVDVAKDNVSIAKTGVAQAEAALRAAKSAVQVDIMRNKDVLAARAALQQARESLSTALQNLDHTQVFSPVDGVVAAKTANVGQSIGANVTILQLSTNGSLYFEAQVSELSATRLCAGQPVTVSVDAMQSGRADLYAGAKSATVVGRVERVVPVVDARTRNFSVRILVPRSRSLFPGMFARGSVMVARHSRALTVPKDALIEKDGRQVVFINENGTAREMTVAPGIISDGNIEVISGLSAGMQVITVGQQALRDGEKVTVHAPRDATLGQ